MTKEELGVLYDEYHKFSADIIYRIIKDWSETEALCNDVFYRIYNMGEKLDTSDEARLRAFIAIASKNSALDYLKRAYVMYEQCTVNDESGEGILDDRFIPEEKLLNTEKAFYQQMVLSRLREKNELSYDIIMKVKCLDISPDDVAKEYGMTRNAVNNRVFRAKRWLIKEMRKIYDK